MCMSRGCGGEDMYESGVCVRCTCVWHLSLTHACGTYLFYMCVAHMSHVHVCGTYLLYMCVAHVSNTCVALHLYCYRGEDVAVRMCVRVDCVCNGRRFCDAVRTCTCVWHMSHILIHVCGTCLLYMCVAHFSSIHAGTYLLYMCGAARLLLYTLTAI